MLSSEALTSFLNNIGKVNVLNIGGLDTDPHTKIMRKSGIEVTTLNIIDPADIVCPYEKTYVSGQDAIWCSHCLEHQVNPGVFLKKIFDDLNENGLLAITVPPPKKEIIGGHVTAWNESILIHQLIMAGFDCSLANVWSYGYNISVVLRKKSRPETKWTMSKADLPLLHKYSPEKLWGK